MTHSLLSDKLTEHARGALLLASDLAQERGARSVSIFHVLYAIATQKGSAGAHMLATLNLTAETLMPHLGTARTQSRGTTRAHIPTIDPLLKDVLVRAYKIAGRAGYPYVGTEHLVHAILATDHTAVRALLEHATKASAGRELTQGAFGDSPLAQLTQFLTDGDTLSGDGMHTEESALDHFTTDLSHTGSDTPLIGRDDIVDDIIAVLSRKEKSNPLLIGAPGVGKTAIIEGLARRIARGDVPAHLMNARILTLDLASLVAGTTYRGEFEARLKDIIAEATADPTVILFIDELHMIVGAGNAQGSLDAANILKPALSRGALRIIGATTPTEYKKHITKDSALTRRFHTVDVPEPSRDDAIAILTGVRTHYEKFHGITISDATIAQLVDWSIRYVPARHLPDKAFDILDEAAARVRVHTHNDAARKKLIQLERTYRSTLTQKTNAIVAEDYDAALALRHEEEVLRARIAAAKKALSRATVTRELSTHDVAHAVARVAKIPVHKIVHTTPSDLNDTLRTWQRRIIGQQDATDAIARTLTRSFAGLAPTGRPVGSFLFLGPTGVGKTFTATTLAETLFDRPNALIRVDMSELTEKHTISKLLGAPAGYVGHGEGGTLTEQIRANPYSVVLFDEIEKAHPDTLNILLQILEDGTITDAAGERADFRHSIVILTSNIGTQALTNSTRMGFAHTQTARTPAALRKEFARVKTDVLTELRATITPEILNRLDEIIVFAPLTHSALVRIARTALAELKTALGRNDVHVRISPAVAPFIARTAGEDIATGARAVRRAVRTHVEDPLAHYLLTHSARPLTLSVRVADNAIVLTHK